MAPPQGIPVTRTGERQASGAWSTAPHPVLESAADGVLTEVNPAASRLLRGARPGARLADAAPAWLARADQDLRDRIVNGSGDTGGGASGWIGARSFEAHPSRTGDGNVVWWLVEDTDRRRAEEALATERERTAFLTEASHVLLSSLNTDRCVSATARLASEYLAEAAVVVSPRGAASCPSPTRSAARTSSAASSRPTRPSCPAWTKPSRGSHRSPHAGSTPRPCPRG